MKILIWISCILAFSIVIVLINSVGVVLGGIPTAILFGGMLWTARKLCSMWDEHKS